jgi:hypothetical protein
MKKYIVLIAVSMALTACVEETKQATSSVEQSTPIQVAAPASPPKKLTFEEKVFAEVDRRMASFDNLCYQGSMSEVLQCYRYNGENQAKRFGDIAWSTTGFSRDDVWRAETTKVMGQGGTLQNCLYKGGSDYKGLRHTLMCYVYGEVFADMHMKRIVTGEWDADRAEILGQKPKTVAELKPSKKAVDFLANVKETNSEEFEGD